MDTYDNTMAVHFRGTLLERADELGRLLHHEWTGHSGCGEVGDFKDVAVEETLATLDEAQAAHAAGELEQVRAALRRIADHSYGQCVDCGDPIDLRRLRTMPATAYCISCQAVHEHGTQRHPGA
jgi:DnaK suppressor protein